MTFDNSKTIIALRLRGFAATVIFLIYIVLIYVGRVVRFPIGNIQETPATIVITTLYIIIIFLPLMLRKMYVYYSDDGDNIVFKYFFAGMITGKKRSIVINKQTLAGYKINKGFLGINPSILITQRLKQGSAKYPPINIGSLRKKDREVIFRSLDKYSKEL